MKISELIEIILNKIKNRTLVKSINARIRFAGRIRNMNTYIDFTRQKEYYRLQNTYKHIVEAARDKVEGSKSSIIFTCWLQGEDQAPDLVKACFHSLRNIPGKNVIVIDSENFHQYIELPDYIVAKWKEGIIPNAHFTDIIRTALLIKYGGYWIDSTVLFTGNVMPEYMERCSLFVFQNVHLIREDEQYLLPSNWLIVSESNNRILSLTLDLLYAYWKKENRVRNYLIYHLFFTIAAHQYSGEWKAVPVYSNQPCHVLQFEMMDKYNSTRWDEILKMSDFHKLNWRYQKNPEIYSMSDYIIDRFGNCNGESE